MPDTNPETAPLAPEPDVSAPIATEPIVRAAPDYVAQARIARSRAIGSVQIALDDLPPVSSVDREYASTRADLICALNLLKAGKV